MARIYQQASRVVVWLCSELDGSVLAIKQVQGGLNHLYSSDLTEAAIDGCDPELILGLGRIFAQPWFERVWTLQEAALARKIIVFIGEQTLEWSLLVKLVTALNRIRERCTTPLLLTEKLWPGNEFKGYTALLQYRTLTLAIPDKMPDSCQSLQEPAALGSAQTPKIESMVF